MYLYKIVTQLSSEEFDALYQTFTDSKADKSAAFLKIIRENPFSPEKDFLAQNTITAAAFYVLKSRLNTRVEDFLLNRVGDPSTHVMRRVMNVSDMLHTNPREISMAALRKLERELVRFDFPYGLMTVYKEMQNLNLFEEESYEHYGHEYNRQVAYAIAMDKTIDMVMQFFRAFDAYYMMRRDKEIADMVRIMEKLDNLSNLYQSHRIYVYKSLTHLIGKYFLEIPDTIRCEFEDTDTIFARCFQIMSDFPDDTFYKNINILFDFLRFIDFKNKQQADRAKIFYEILDYKLEELVVRYHFNANTSLFLEYKIRHHTQNNTLPALLHDVEEFVGDIQVDPYRLSFFYNYKMFLAYAYLLNGKYKKAARIIYDMRNAVNLRKYQHADLESKFLLALAYSLDDEDYDLANQLQLSLQRQLRKKTLECYDNTKYLLRILSGLLHGKAAAKNKTMIANAEKWQQGNTGRYALLGCLDIEYLLKHVDAPAAK